MKKRLVYYDIEHYLTHKNALVITGMRQVGKSTLMQQLYDAVADMPKVWLDLDNPLEQKVIEGADFRQIHDRLRAMAGAKEGRLLVAIDEIQNAPEVTSFIKYAIDHFSTKFIVTGSSAYYMRHVFPESLSGRKFLWTLSPMLFTEYLYFADRITLTEAQNRQKNPVEAPQDTVIAASYAEAYRQFLLYGGFPEVVLTNDIDTKKKVIKNIVVSFFEKDIRFLGDLKDTRELRDLILLLVARVGQPLDITKIASELNLNRAKVYSYISLLESTFFLHLLPKFSSSVDRTISGRKKIYFSDTGILTSLGSVNDGQLLENAVVNQLWDRGALAYFNKRNTSEIDVIVDKRVAFEVKLHGSMYDVAAVSSIARKLHISQAFVVSPTVSEGKDMRTPFYW